MKYSVVDILCIIKFAVWYLCCVWSSIHEEIFKCLFMFLISVISVLTFSNVLDFPNINFSNGVPSLTKNHIFCVGYVLCFFKHLFFMQMWLSVFVHNEMSRSRDIVTLWSITFSWLHDLSIVMYFGYQILKQASYIFLNWCLDAEVGNFWINNWHYNSYIDNSKISNLY